MLESVLEKKLKKQVEYRDGLCYKFVSPNNAGVPDRIVISKYGIIYFVELKATEKDKPRKLQDLQIRILCEHQCKVFIVDSEESLQDFLFHYDMDEYIEDERYIVRSEDEF